MKKLLVITVLAILIFAPFSTLKAQYEIASYDVELSGSTISFEEDQPPAPYMAAEERKLNVDTNDDSLSISWITIIVYKLDATVVYGPYTVYEDVIFEMDIDEDEWAVDVTSYSSGTKASVWIE